MSNISELLERVQNATGLDRDVDVAIMAACFDWAKAEPPYYAPHLLGDEPIYWHAPNWLQKRPCPNLTDSIDAAVALVGRVLPLFAIFSLTYWPINPSNDPKHVYSSCEIYAVKDDGWHNFQDGRWEGTGRTPALAILAALLMVLYTRGAERE